MRRGGRTVGRSSDGDVAGAGAEADVEADAALEHQVPALGLGGLRRTGLGDRYVFGSGEHVVVANRAHDPGTQETVQQVLGADLALSQAHRRDRRVSTGPVRGVREAKDQAAVDAKQRLPRAEPRSRSQPIIGCSVEPRSPGR